MQALKWIGGILLAVLLVMGLSLAFGWFGVGYTSTVGKAQQNAETQVFQNSQAYIQGKNQEVNKLKLEYELAKGQDEKHAIRVTILNDLAGFDQNKLSSDLREFVDKLRSE